MFLSLGVYLYYGNCVKRITKKSKIFQGTFPCVDDIAILIQHGVDVATRVLVDINDFGKQSLILVVGDYLVTNSELELIADELVTTNIIQIHSTKLPKHDDLSRGHNTQLSQDFFGNVYEGSVARDGLFHDDTQKIKKNMGRSYLPVKN